MPGCYAATVKDSQTVEFATPSFRRRPESMNTAGAGIPRSVFMDPGLRRDDEKDRFDEQARDDGTARLR